jgi:hypothetical protein
LGLQIQIPNQEGKNYLQKKKKFNRFHVLKFSSFSMGGLEVSPIAWKPVMEALE